MIDEEYVKHLEDLLLEVTTELLAIRECVTYMDIDPFY